MLEERPLTVIELFGGIGACSKALSRIGVPFVVSDYVENDKYAVDSFNAIHGTDFAPQDVTKWNKTHFCDNCLRTFDTGKFSENDDEFYEEVCPYCGCYPTTEIKGNIDLIMHGSPCQDFSAAGLGKGGDEGSGTRSSLMYETIRIVEMVRPKYVVWENVKNILSKKHKHNFDAYLERMRELGYTNFYQVLNAKNYGIPQNRERVFTVSILNDDRYAFPQGEQNDNQIDRIGGAYGQTTRWGVYNEEGLAPTLTAAMGQGGGHTPMVPDFEFPNAQPLDKSTKDYLEDEVDDQYVVKGSELQNYRRDFGSRGKEIDVNAPAPTLTASMGAGGGNVPYFKFPLPQPLGKRLKDILEPVVDEKFYLSDEQVKKIKMSTFNQNRTRIQNDDVAQTLCARDWKDPKCVKVGDLDIKGQDSIKRVYSPEGVSPTLTTMGGGNREPKIIDDTYANRDARVYEEYSPALRSERSGLKVTEPFIAASRGRNPENPSDRTVGAPTEQRLEPKFDGTTNTLTSVQKDNYVVEPNVLTPKRTEYGKQIRKAYESGEIQEKRGNMTALEPRRDGVSNTLTSVQKDNYVMEPQGFVEGAYQEFADENGYVPDQFNPYNRAEIGDVAPTQTTQCGSTTSSATVLVKEEQPQYRVRKLTPKECWRLMGFDDADYEKAARKNSKTQLYKQAGNSIVVNVLEAIFTNLLK